MKQTSVQQVAIDNKGQVELTFGLDIAEGDEVQFTNPLRRVVMPNGDLNQNLDEIDAYLVANNYPALSADQRTAITEMDAAARGNPQVEAARQKWIEQNKPVELPTAEPPPTE